jgi:hypothetical protein
VACAGLSGAVPGPRAGGTSSLAAGSALPAPPATATGHPPAGSTGVTGTSQKRRAGAATAGLAGGTQPGASGLRTSCRAVVHIGDSTSEGLISPSYLPNPAKRIAAQYQDVGVQTVRTDIVGARSVIETLPGTADVAIGSATGRMSRIQRMMDAAHGQPVMWVGVISLLAGGPYAEANMQQWNAALRQACPRYPNMRVFDWASLAQPSWFISDGIHYTSAGYAIRGQQIAQGLAKAFPARGRSTGCVIS